MQPAQKKRLSERDICTKFITPAITGGGEWDVMSQVAEQQRIMPKVASSPSAGATSSKPSSPPSSPPPPSSTPPRPPHPRESN